MSPDAGCQVAARPWSSIIRWLTAPRNFDTQSKRREFHGSYEGVCRSILSRGGARSEDDAVGRAGLQGRSRLYQLSAGSLRGREASRCYRRRTHGDPVLRHAGRGPCHLEHHQAHRWGRGSQQEIQGQIRARHKVGSTITLGATAPLPPGGAAPFGKNPCGSQPNTPPGSFRLEGRLAFAATAPRLCGAGRTCGVALHENRLVEETP